MRPVNRLGAGALVTAITAAAVAVVATPVELVLQVRGGATFSTLVFAVGVVVAIIAVVALVLGIVALQRPFSRASPSAAIGVAAYLLVGQIAGLATVIVLTSG